MYLFTYDLLMDAAFLAGYGVTPNESFVGSVSGYALRIGDNASLVKTPSVVVYGIIHEVDKKDVRILLKNRREIICETILVRASDINLRRTRAIAFLEDPADCASDDGSFAGRLAALAYRLSLPSEYVASLQAVRDQLEFGDGKTQFDFYGA